MSSIARQCKQRAGRLALYGVLALCTVGAIMAAFLYSLAPVLIRVAVGPGFEAAIPVLRLLSLILPLLAVTNALGMNLLLPLGKDRLFATIVIGAGILNIGLAIWWIPLYGQLGAAYAVVTSQLR